MADHSKDLINCRVLIRDSISGELVADTAVEEYDARRNVLSVFSGALNGPTKNRLSLLALSKSGVLEYSGNLRKISGGMAEIALYGERKKESRNFTRYELKTEGRVEALLIGDTRIDLRKPVPVSVLNISANGILFRSDIDAFRRGSKVRVRVGLKQNSFVGEYEIVRSQNRNKETAEYGCRNILPQVEQGDEDEEIQDPKLRREEAARRKIRNGEKIDKVEPVFSPDDGEASYDVLQQQMEQAYGYTDWMNRVAGLQDSIGQATYEGSLHALSEDIFRHVMEMDEAVILNCIHRKRPEEEKQFRHLLNLALLGALMGKWLHFDEPMIRKLIEMGIQEQIDEETQGQSRLDILYARILTVADLYDARAAHPNHEKAGIPLVFLEQMRYRGIDQPAGSVKMLEWALAENVLHCILHRKILLADHTIGQLLYVLPNDVEHPILAVKEEVYQEIAPWRLLWIILEPDAANGNRGGKH
ncbi:MAG: PilZ domain-containing protein [Eubacterium sp.]|nr:PilZ domain-containing protein [Eubacterium sp.]